VSPGYFGKGFSDNTQAQSSLGRPMLRKGASSDKITANTKVRDMTLTVSLTTVCGFCKGDIAAMADEAGLKFLTKFEEKTNTFLYWQPGMKLIKERKYK
jgi:hypothetical protein